MNLHRGYYVRGFTNYPFRTVTVFQRLSHSLTGVPSG
jgi:hypothetical protein